VPAEIYCIALRGAVLIVEVGLHTTVQLLLLLLLLCSRRHDESSEAHPQHMRVCAAAVERGQSLRLTVRLPAAVVLQNIKQSPACQLTHASCKQHCSSCCSWSAAVLAALSHVTLL
jgi:hypothetical protein